MDELPKCPGDAPPVVRLSLRHEKCPRKGVVRHLRTPNDIHSYLKTEYGCEAQEWAVVIGLGSNNAILGIHEVAIGGLDSTVVDPRVVFAGLLLMGAAAFVFCHNHPSGSTQPSTLDVTMTRQLKDAGKILGIRMVDHIIVSGTGYTSFLAEGMFPS